MPLSRPTLSSVKTLTVVLTLVGLTACSAPNPSGIHDPYEAQNRKMHAFNRGLDSKMVRPASTGYAKTVPEGVQNTVSNFSDNLGTPGSVANQILHGDLNGATRNTFRFAINTTLGFAGLADVATGLGLPEDDSDFGETLAVWGVPEGAYLELPALGPSTERDAFGKVVDWFLDPMGYLLPKPEKYYGTVAGIASKVGDRGRYAESVDSVLYDSADSYAQSRIIYLQNRRFELGQDAPEDEIDPYAELYGGTEDE